MAPEDEEKTTFITDRGLYCYRVMPFGLKNAGATYQRLVNKVFKGQIGRNMEVYVDDMLVKSRASTDHLADLEETFGALRRHKMKLNPTKCAFGVTSGKFLGFMVSRRGIEANPEKIRAIQEMTAPKIIKEVQRLAGKVASLNRFVSRSAERCLPFFQVLRRPKDFCWTAECKQAFEELKNYLGAPPLLAKPEPGEGLLLYLAVSPMALAAVLVREDAKAQQPVYYVSRALRDAETRYSKLEKLIYCLLIAARRLRPYFQEHTITVLTDQPIRAVLHRADASGRIAKWAIELTEFDINYRPRPSIKAQILADFVLECTAPVEAELESSEIIIGGRPSPNEAELWRSSFPEERADLLEGAWVLHVDGSSNSSGAGAGLVLVSPEGIVTEYALRFEFPTTNNGAEYEALIAGLQIARELKVGRLQVYSDSQLVVGQVGGSYEAREESMVMYLGKVKNLIPAFDSFDIRHIPRTGNTRADLLSKLATSAPAELPKEVFLETL